MDLQRGLTVSDRWLTIRYHYPSKLNQVMEEYRQFLAQPRSVKQLNAELEAKVQLLT
ncbi:hypothetical protein [Neomoorella humiferrea]|uniref:hypothetical protein n=1 Tax=Neomoorella humiferrea TaxID=676965 RepID=UPI0030D3B0C2